LVHITWVTAASDGRATNDAARIAAADAASNLNIDMMTISSSAA